MDRDEEIGSVLFAMRGAVTDPTAFPYRERGFHILVEARWTDTAQDDEHVEWLCAFYEALQPQATGGATLNFLTGDGDEERVRAAYGNYYDRLVGVKNEWDPANSFSTGWYVEPSGRSGADTGRWYGGMW